MYHQSKKLFYPSSSIASSNKLDTTLLTICKKVKNNNDYNAKKAGDAATKFEANKEFLEKNLELKNNESNNRSRSKSENDKLDNNLKNLNQPIYENH